MPTESCTQTGVLAPVVGIIGSIQALETLKTLTGIGNTLMGVCYYWTRTQWNGE